MSLHNNSDLPFRGLRQRDDERLARLRHAGDLERRLHSAGVGVRLLRAYGLPMAHGENTEVDAVASLAAFLNAVPAWAGPASLHLGRCLDDPGGEHIIAVLEQAERDLSGVTVSFDLDDSMPATAASHLLAEGRYARCFAFVGREDTHRVLPSALRLTHRLAPPTPALSAAWHACVRSHCPLLPAESTRTVIAGLALAAPPRTAWLPMSLSVPRFARPNGDIDHAALEAALDACIEAGDQLHDCLYWSCPGQQEDARLNRRLAIHLTGLGDLVVQRRMDPSSLACLRELDGLVGDVHDGLWRRSRQLASLIGAAPILTERQPTAFWRDETHRRDWSERWYRAVQRAQVRHRNLLVLSPESLLPSSRTADCSFADLLPLLAHADAIACLGGPCVDNWSAFDRGRFLQRLHAQIGRFNATSFIAAGA